MSLGLLERICLRLQAYGSRPAISASEGAPPTWHSNGAACTAAGATNKTVLPDAEVLQKELEKTRLMLESRLVPPKKTEEKER